MKRNFILVHFLLFLLSVFYQNTFGQLTDSLPHFTTVDLGNWQTYGGAWGDYNNDGNEDLFVGNLYGNDYLFENRDGILVQIDSGIIVTGSDVTSSACWGDYNNDGYLDLLIGSGDESRGRPNRLLKNTGEGNFVSVGEEVFVEDTSKTNECSFVDFDNDGLLDIFFTNFYSYNKIVKNEDHDVFINHKDGVVDVERYYGYGICFGDLNNDRRLDLFHATLSNTPNRLYIHNRAIITPKNRTACLMRFY